MCSGSRRYSGAYSPSRPASTDFKVGEAPLRVPYWTSGRVPDPWRRYREVRQRVPPSLTRELAG